MFIHNMDICNTIS